MSAHIPEQLDQLSKKELVEFAKTAHGYSVELNAQLAKANERIVELEQELKNGIFEASCYDADVIQCLNKMAYEHNEKEIPRFRNKAKRCAERIGARTSDLNKFAIEQKIEGVNWFSENYCDDEHSFLADKAIEQLRKEKE